MTQEFELVVGLEVHIQLLTQTKLFCNDAASFGAAPNTQVSAISLAHPGTLPTLNPQAVNMAIQLGLALGCQITPIGHFDRKHYFYPDLPKGYQTSQQTAPILVGGSLQVGSVTHPKTIQIHHIHLEEDAGKSLHDVYDNYTCIDLNRAGTPLLELVTEPVITSSDDAFAFITQLRKLVRWLGICDGNMEEGSMRADANISVRPVGTTTLGTKVEVKNLNSIRNVKRAIEGEMERQIALINSGGQVVQQTRGYDAPNNTTITQREKEEANDYRYLPCPDIPPFYISQATIDAVQAGMPTLPNVLALQYCNQLGLSEQDALTLTDDKETAHYFEALRRLTPHTKAAANWIMGPIRNWLNQQNTNITSWPLAPVQVAAIIELVANDTVNFSMAAEKLMPYIIDNQTVDAQTAAQTLGIVQEKNQDQLADWVQEVITAMPDKVTAYKKGKKGLIGLFMGEVKRLSKGKADPKKTMELLEKELHA